MNEHQTESSEQEAAHLIIKEWENYKNEKITVEDLRLNCSQFISLLRPATNTTVRLLIEELSKFGVGNKKDTFAHILHVYGVVLSSRDPFLGKLLYWEMIQDYYGKGGLEARADCILNRALILYRFCKHEEARDRCGDAMGFYDQRRRYDAVGRCYWLTGLAWFAQGFFEKAIDCYDFADMNFTAHLGSDNDSANLSEGIIIQRALCSLNKVEALIRAGAGGALELIKKVEPFLKFEPIIAANKKWLARCHLLHGVILGNLFESALAIEALNKAQAIYKNEQDMISVAGCHYLQALAWLNLDKLDNAIEACKLALPVLKNAGDQGDYFGCLFIKATAHFKLGQVEQANLDFENVEPFLAAPILSTDLAQHATMLQNGVLMFGTGQIEESVQLLNEVDFSCLSPCDQLVFCIIKAVGLKTSGQKLAALEQMRLIPGLVKRARRRGQINEFYLPCVEGYGRALHYAVRMAFDCNELEMAFTTAQNAKASLFCEMRARVFQGAVRIPAKLVGPRKMMTNHLMNRQVLTPQVEQNTKEAIGKFHEAWRVEITKIGEITNQILDDDCQDVSLNIDKGVSIVTAIRRALPAGWALLDFWVMSLDEIKVFVLKRDKFSVETLQNPSQNAQFNSAADSWRRAMQSGQPDALHGAVLNHLYMLFEPLRGLLQDITGLYLVPHDFLHTLPLHAARKEDPRKTTYLCDEFEISYLPSAALLLQLPKLDLSGRLHSVAIPEVDTPNSLPYVHWESCRLEKILAKTCDGTFHLGPSGTYANATNWKNASVLHISGHGGGWKGIAPLSYMRLADDLLLAHDVMYCTEKLRDGCMVVLNGCETGVRDPRAVDEAMGLMTAFLLRGAGLVLATQWPVLDSCAAALTISFLVQVLRDKVRPTEALQKAQKAVRELTTAQIIEHQNECEAFLKTHGYDVGTGNLLRCNNSGSLGRSHERLYDDPIYWCGFHFVGRVT